MRAATVVASVLLPTALRSTTGSDEFRVYSDDEIRPGLLPRRMPARTREGCGNTTGCYTNVFSEGDRWISFVVEPRS